MRDNDSIFNSILKQSKDKVAIINDDGEAKTFGQLSRSISAVAWGLQDEPESRAALLIKKNFGFTSALLGCFLARVVAVPLFPLHPLAEMKYCLMEAEVGVLIYDETAFHEDAFALLKHFPTLKLLKLGELINPRVRIALSLEMMEENLEQLASNPNRGCLIMFTSGSTGNPKGVVHTMSSLESQTSSLIEAWNISPTDRILHVLPVHHIHGIVNALLCIIKAGGSVEFLEKFNPESVWKALQEHPITLFMAVPTIYSKLLASSSPYKGALPNVRICISGSAALPTPLREAWKDVAGHVLLERYGMTEIGMALSCGLSLDSRIDSSVGFPLPGVQVKLVDTETGNTITDMDKEGEIYVASQNMFREYYNRPEATASAFKDGWFRTGDIALQSSLQNGSFFIRGRESVDIIKSGGYKISALEVEKELLALGTIKECAVVGVKDSEWGERVAVILVAESSLTLDELRSVLKPKIAFYKIPTLLKVLPDAIPRNAMGKVNKKDLIKLFSE
jgi:acyl-CoA synthetase (AMP-forming)/AMP-acid ligase II